MDNLVTRKPAAQRSARTWRRPVWRYAIAVGAVSLAVIARLVLGGVLGNGVAFITFYPAVAVTGMVAGGRAGLLATALSAAAADWLVLGPQHGFGMDKLADVVSLGLFVVAGAVISVTAGMLERARKRERETAEREGLRRSEEQRKAAEVLAAERQEANERLEARVAERTRELGESERRFRALMTASSDVLYRMSPDWSEMLQVQGGKFLADLVSANRNWLKEYIPPDDQPQVQAIIKEAILTRRTFELEHRAFRTDGTLGWTFSRATPLLDEKGDIVEWFGAATDITERKRAEEALRQSEVRYHGLFQTLIEGFCIVDVVFDSDDRAVDYRFLEVNPAFEDQSGLRNAKGKLVRELIPDLEPHWFEIFGKVARTGEPVRFVNEASALKRWFEVMAYRVGGVGSRKVAILFNDITDRERAQRRVEANVAALTRMHELSRRSLGTEGLEPLLQEIIDAAVAITDASFGTLQLLEGDSLRIVAHHGHQAPFLEFFAAAENRASVCGEATRRGERVVVPDIEVSPLFAGTPSLEVLRQAGVRAAQSTPMMSRTGTLLGILTTQWSQPFTPDEHDLWRVDLVARQASDVIEHVRSKEALARRAEEMERLLELVPAAIWVANDPKCVSIVGNRLANEFYEARGGENVSATSVPAVRRFYTPQGRELAAEELPMQVAAATNQNVRDVELHVLRPSGGRMTMLGSATPLLNEAGDVRGCIGVFVDITERKRAEEELRESEHRFRAMADGTPLSIWVADAQGRNRFVNRAYCEFFGLEPDAVQDFGWRRLLHPEDSAAYTRDLMAALRERKKFRTQARLRRHDGEWRWIECYAEPRFSIAGDFLGMAGSSVDITERRRFQEELERLVAERTAKLQELVGELEHFSYTITHDMRAPLRGMQGFSELMAEACQSCERQDAAGFMRRIRTSATRMDALITDALNYSKAVRQELVLSPVDAGGLLRGMLDSYPELQPSKAGIKIKGEIPPVMGNEAGLTQCFSNLLGNAVKFVKPGKRPEISIWAEMHEDGQRSKAEGKRVRIWVEDHGIGIPKSMQTRVFDMFSRGQNTHAGTGIGLALVRKVVSQMGGRVGVESEEGKGSRFWLELQSGDVRRQN